MGKVDLIMGYLVCAITPIGLIFISNIYSILIFFVIYGIFYAMIDGIQIKSLMNKISV